MRHGVPGEILYVGAIAIEDRSDRACLVNSALTEPCWSSIVRCVCQDIERRKQCGGQVGVRLDVNYFTKCIVRIGPRRIIGSRVCTVVELARHVSIYCYIEDVR